MNDNITSRLLPISIAILVAAFAGGLSLLHAAESPPGPLYPGLTPACPVESLTSLSLPNTTIESAVVDASNRMCLVTAIVTHPPAGNRVKVWIGLPLDNWNGRFQGTGGGGFLGGHPNSLRGPVALGFSAGATDTGHEGGSGKFALDANGRQDWQAIIDNAYLGIHEMTVLGKALTNHGFNGPGARPTGLNEAIIRWVEEGKAPDKLLAEKRDANGKVIRTRPLFPWPQVAKYNGNGSTDEEKNFTSKEGNRA